MEIFKLDILFLNFDYSSFFYLLLLNFCNFFDPNFYNVFFIMGLVSNLSFAQNITFFFSIKFVISVSFLILIRGGTPRYRYDYLTKLGWLKFIGLIILCLFISLFYFFLF